MTESTLMSLKQFSRIQMRDIWRCSENNDMDGLDDEERQLARIMREHRDEYHNQFEFADVTWEHEFDPDTETNPFMHITFHSIVENQLKDRDPIEVFQFYNAMRKKKTSHHDTIHLIAAIAMEPFFSMMKHQLPFDNESYIRMLKRFKTKKPDRIYQMLGLTDEEDA